MSGTREGGIQAAKQNKAHYGEDFYKRIGAMSNASWEKNGRKPRGFSANREAAKRAGAKGGAISKRRPRNG